MDNAILMRGDCIANQREIKEILLRSFFKSNPFCPLNGRQRTALDRFRPLAESSHKRIKVELISHVSTLLADFEASFWCVICRICRSMFRKRALAAEIARFRKYTF
jgi:hypothetical protein